MSTSYDCRSCGACCSSPKNKPYVEVSQEDIARLTARQQKRLVVVDDEGYELLRLRKDGRCASLQGTIGVSVRCGIYARRPEVCSMFEPGSVACRAWRIRMGVVPSASQTRASA